MARRPWGLMIAIALLAACGGQPDVTASLASSSPSPEAPEQAAPTASPSPEASSLPEPTPTAGRAPLTPTTSDIVDEAAVTASDWSFVLDGGALLIANEEGVWQVDRDTGEPTRIIDHATTRAFDNARGTVVYQTVEGAIWAQRGDEAERVLVEPASDETLTLATVALADGGHALVLRRAGTGEGAVETLVSVSLATGAERILGDVAVGEERVSSVSSYNKRVAVTHTIDGRSRVSFLNLDGDALEFDGNPQPVPAESPQIAVGDIDEEQIFGWIERRSDTASLRLVVGDYRTGAEYREVELGSGWRPTHLASGGGTTWVISRVTDTGEPMPALRVVDRDGTLVEAAGPIGFTTPVNAQTDGPYRFVRELEAGLELWCRSQYVSTATPDSGGERLPLGDITDEDRAELADGVARWMNPPDENGEVPPAGEIVVVPVGEVALVGAVVDGDPTRVRLALWLRRTTSGWAGEEFVACSDPR